MRNRNLNKEAVLAITTLIVCIAALTATTVAKSECTYYIRKEILVFEGIEVISYPEKDPTEEMKNWDGEKVYFYLDTGSYPVILDIHQTSNLESVTTLVMKHILL